MASGDLLAYWGALNNEPPDDDFATLDTILTASDDEPDDVVPVLDFDSGATQEYASFSGVMPSHYDGGGVTLTLVWCSEATTGDVKWDAAFKSFTDNTDDLDAKQYAAVNSATDAVAGTARVLTYTPIAFTDGADMDSVVANEYFRLTITRDSADAADTVDANDAELVAVILRET